MLPAPKRRIWLYPASDSALEVVILGAVQSPDSDEPVLDADNIAAIYVHIRNLCDSWPGWQRVETLMLSTAVVGLRCTLGKYAAHTDLLAEGMRMFHGLNAMSWKIGDGSIGAVGTW